MSIRITQQVCHKEILNVDSIKVDEIELKKLDSKKPTINVYGYPRKDGKKVWSLQSVHVDLSELPAHIRLDLLTWAEQEIVRRNEV